MCFVIGWSGDNGWLDCSFMSLNNNVEQKLKRLLGKHCASHQQGWTANNWATLKPAYVILIIMKWTTVVAKIITTLYFHQLKNGFKSVISIFCYSVSVGNISLHFQTFINCNNPVRFLFAQGVWQQPVLHTEIWSHHHPVCLERHEESEQTETD